MKRNKEGLLRRRLRKLTWPIFVETSLMILLGIGDTFMLGGYSDYAVGAVGAVNQILNTVFLLFGVVTTGTSVLVSRYMGERNDLSVRAIIVVSIAFNLLFGAAVSLILWLNAESIITSMEIRPELFDDAVIYMKIIGAFAFLQSLALTISAILRSLQRPKFPMFSIAVVNVVNIIGDYVFIYGHWGAPEMGVAGAATTTIIARSIYLGILIFSLFGIVMKRQFHHSDVLPFKWKKLSEVLKIGLPSAGEQLSYATAQIVILFFINQISNEALIARTYVANIVMITYLYTFAVSQSCSISVSYLIGERRLKAANVITLICTKETIIVSIIVGALIAAFARPIISLFTDNQEILMLTAIVVWIDVVLEVGRALNMVVIQALRAAGDYIFPVAFGALSVWGISVGISYLLGITFGLGLCGIWLGMALDENFRGICMLHRWNKQGWAKKFRIEK